MKKTKKCWVVATSEHSNNVDMILYKKPFICDFCKEYASGILNKNNCNAIKFSTKKEATKKQQRSNKEATKKQQRSNKEA